MGRVIGQDEAISTISRAIQMHVQGLQTHSALLAHFYFRAHRRGKTEVAKALADFLFDDPKKLIRIDMSEYWKNMQLHGNWRLLAMLDMKKAGNLLKLHAKTPTAFCCSMK